MLAIVWVIFAGVTHFDSNIAFDFPPRRVYAAAGIFYGAGSALLISVYDYWGYYNVNFFAGEIKEPEKTIPRAIILSISLVALIYIVMNISILGVIPWREFSAARQYRREQICYLDVYGAALRNDRRHRRNDLDNVHGVRVGLFAAAGIFASAVRGGS